MFFQNVFCQEFIGNWILNERQFALSFKVPAAARKASYIVASSVTENYDLSATADRTLTLYYAMDKNFHNYHSIAVNVAGATPASTTANEIVTALNADASFSDRFEAFAEYSADTEVGARRVVIRQKNNNVSLGGIAMRWYIANTGAEQKLKFNRYAGVNEIPSFFVKHTIDNRRNYTDSQGMLIPLSHAITGNTVANPTVVTSPNHGLTTGDSILIVNSNSSPTIDGTRTVTVTGANTFTVAVNVTTAGTRGEWMSAYEQTLISDAGFTASSAKEDWEMLSGRSNLFTFTKNTVDGSDRITTAIEYNAGAAAGDLAIKRQYSYTSANLNPDQVTVIPYVLQSGDLVTPS